MEAVIASLAVSIQHVDVDDTTYAHRTLTYAHCTLTYAHRTLTYAHRTLTYAHSHSNFDTDNTPYLQAFATCTVIALFMTLTSL